MPVKTNINRKSGNVMTGTSLSCIRLLGLVFWNLIHLEVACCLAIWPGEGFYLPDPCLVHWLSLWLWTKLLTPGLDNTRLFISLTAGAGTRCMSLPNSPPSLCSYGCITAGLELIMNGTAAWHRQLFGSLAAVTPKHQTRVPKRTTIQKVEPWTYSRNRSCFDSDIPFTWQPPCNH